MAILTFDKQLEVHPEDLTDKKLRDMWKSENRYDKAQSFM